MHKRPFLEMVFVPNVNQEVSIIDLDTFFNVSLHTYYMVSERIKNKIWNDASKIKGKNPNTWRKDNCGKKVRRGSYGTNGKFAWQADHKHPVAKVVPLSSI